jgi:hypothetical protein
MNRNLLTSFCIVLFATSTLWAQESSMVRVTTTSLSRNGMDVNISDATEIEKLCIEAQVQEIKNVGIAPTKSLSTSLKVSLFSEIAVASQIIIRMADSREIEILDDISDINSTEASLSVTLSAKGVCTIVSFDKLREIYGVVLF